jgi:hypothetical protein
MRMLLYDMAMGMGIKYTEYTIVIEGKLIIGFCTNFCTTNKKDLVSVRYTRSNFKESRDEKIKV